MEEVFTLIFTLESEDRHQLDLIEAELNEVKNAEIFSLQQQAKRVRAEIKRGKETLSTVEVQPGAAQYYSKAELEVFAHLKVQEAEARIRGEYEEILAEQPNWNNVLGDPKYSNKAGLEALAHFKIPEVEASSRAEGEALLAKHMAYDSNALHQLTELGNPPSIPDLANVLGIPEDELEYMLDPNNEGQPDADDKWDIEIDPVTVPIVVPNLGHAVKGGSYPQIQTTVTDPATKKPAPKKAAGTRRAPVKKSATPKRVDTNRGL